MEHMLKIKLKVSHSNNTVKDRIDKIADNCQHPLQENISTPFAIQFDETTMVSDKSVLIVYVNCLCSLY